MKRIAIVGNIGHGEETSSGQIIRTRILYDALKKNYTAQKIYMINTGDYSRHFAGILFKTFISLFKTDVYIVILSGNGRKVFFPILYFFSKAFGKIVLNNIIGGDYATSIQKYPQYIKYSNSFSVNWVQTAMIKKEVEQEGVQNVEVLPNSKPLTIVNPKDIETKEEKIVHFCTFSRVSKAKGVETAIKAIEQINEEAEEMIATLTIYGKPDDDYKAEFKSLMSKRTKAIHYGGIVPFDKTPEVLSKYFMLLFPTTFYGEGFPGTILDAYASGLPVLASDWKFNPELITEGRTGYLYDHTSAQDFKEKLKLAIRERNKVNEMRFNCLKEAEKYTPENVMPIIFNKIDLLRGAIK